jgi:glycerate 2-kinase
MTDREILRRLFDVAVAEANPAKAVAENLPERRRGRIVVVGAGKAAIAMASAVEAHWQGALEGFVVAPHGYPSQLKRIETLHASHPVPDDGSIAAADKALALAATLGRDDLLLALISGGGSALMAKPLPGIAMADKLSIVRALLKSGANIAELNCVRKELSAIKGGRLAQAANGASIHTLVMSDVPGDDPAIVASGPTQSKATTKSDARTILERYRIDAPAAVKQLLAGHDEAAVPLSSKTETRVIVSPRQSFLAAETEAKKHGLNVLYLGDRIEGESREVAKVHAALALHIAQHDAPLAKPCVILSGGETSVTVRGSGRGGRNVEFALALAVALGGAPGIAALAADTDGVDGMEPIAGAIITPDTLMRGRTAGRDPVAVLEDNDGHGFFQALGDQIVTGPTQTNVNDFRAILIR